MNRKRVRPLRLVLALAFVLATVSSSGFALAQTRSEEAYRKKAAALADDDAKGHYRLGLWCERKGWKERARFHLEKVIAIDPDHAGARRKLGYVKVSGRWMTVREKDEAEYRKRLAKLAGDDVKGHLTLGTWCRRKGLLECAVERFEKALALDPTGARAKRALTETKRALLEARVSAYVEASEEKREDLLPSIRSADRIEADAEAHWIRFVRDRLKRLPRHDGREVSMTHHPKFSVKYRLLGRTKGKNLSLLIFLHGGGPSSSVNDRSWEGFKRLTDTPFDLMAVPRVWDDSTGAGWVMESGPLVVRSVLAEVKRAYDVDPNRVYLAGSSMGGYGTCWIGCLEPDRFAALGIVAAGYGGGGARLDNLLHTPITCHIGENDRASDHIGTARALRKRLDQLRRWYPKGYRCLYQEYPGMGHSLGPEAYREVFDWMKNFERDPVPRKIVWTPFTHTRYITHKHYYYWLKLERPRTGMRLEAEIKSGNEIVVSTREVRSFTVFLNARLIDPSKPVKLVVNGKVVHDDRVRPSLTAIVESLIAKEDPYQVFCYRIDVGK